MKPKGELLAIYVVESNLVDTMLDAERVNRRNPNGSPNASVRKYRRTVSADGESVSVWVIVVRSKHDP